MESIGQSESNTGQSGSKKKSKEFSEVWVYFYKVGVGPRAISKCKACGKEYKTGGGRYGTSTLRRHIFKCPELNLDEVGHRVIDGKYKKMKPKIARELLAAPVIKHDLSFSFVEYDGIRAFLKYINPSLSCISRNTLVSDITKLYLKKKVKLQKVLANIHHRVCLTSDVWTACTGEGYICLMCHFVDDNWKLNSKILNFDHFPPPHSGPELAAKVLEFLKEWKIDKKVFSLTLDNASSNDAMQKILKDRLTMHGGLICGGEFFHIRCTAHVLNLIVQEGIKFGDKALSKIRESVKYVKSSEGRMTKFEECVKSIPNIDTRIGLRLDICTRWNSTYLMLVSALKYKNAFNSFYLSDKNYAYSLSSDEWIIGEKLCEFLEPFYVITNLFSGFSYPTSNLYFMQVWRIECLLKENLSNKDPNLSGMCKEMFKKFDKYWGEYSTVLSFGAILDPRFKFGMLEYFYSKVESDASKCQEKMALVKSKLYTLFECYNNATMSSLVVLPSKSSPLCASYENQGITAKSQQIFYEMAAYESQVLTKAEKSQLYLYLEEPKLDYTQFQNLDMLEFWKGQKSRLPDLALMACDILAIPITTVASESSFSIGARVLTKYRSSMILENFQALICTRNWLHGFVSNDEDCAKIKKVNQVKHLILWRVVMMNKMMI